MVHITLGQNHTQLLCGTAGVTVFAVACMTTRTRRVFVIHLMVEFRVMILMRPLVTQDPLKTPMGMNLILARLERNSILRVRLHRGVVLQQVLAEAEER